MTIDEAIEHAREEAKKNYEMANAYIDYDAEHLESIRCKQCAEEHEQLAEWLEELKTLRESKNNLVDLRPIGYITLEAFNKGRADAIDEFVKECCEYENLTFDKYAIQRIKSIAEQLKAGGKE